MLDESSYDVSPTGQSPLPLADEDTRDVSQDVREYEQLERLEQISSVLQDLALQQQDDETVASDTSVVVVDSAQWVDLTGRLQELRDMTSLMLFLVLLVVCGVASLIGGHLWKVFSEGFRR